MIVYKLDRAHQIMADARIREMNLVLSEIAPSLRILRDLLNQHKNTISEPNIDQYREELQQMVAEAIRLTHTIAANSQQLSSVTDRTGKQLTSMQEQIADGLKGQRLEPADSQAIQSTAETTAKRGVTASTNRSMRFTKTFTRV